MRDSKKVKRLLNFMSDFLTAYYAIYCDLNGSNNGQGVGSQTGFFGAFCHKSQNHLQSYQLFFLLYEHLCVSKISGTKVMKGLVLAPDIWMSGPKLTFLPFSDIQMSGRI